MDGTSFWVASENSFVVLTLNLPVLTSWNLILYGSSKTHPLTPAHDGPPYSAIPNQVHDQVWSKAWIRNGINLPERHMQFDLDDMYNFVEICESRNSWVIQCLNYNGDWILDKLVIDLIIAVPTLTKNTKARMAKKGTLNFILSNVLVVLTIITLHNQFALFQFLFSLIKLFCLDSFSMNMLSKNC